MGSAKSDDEAAIWLKNGRAEVRRSEERWRRSTSSQAKPLDAALLDENLNGQRIDDIAVVTRRKVPFAFVTDAKACPSIRHCYWRLQRRAK